MKGSSGAFQVQNGRSLAWPDGLFCLNCGGILWNNLFVGGGFSTMTSFVQFREKFSVHLNNQKEVLPASLPDFPAIDEAFRTCIAELGGMSFNAGLYQVFTPDGVKDATAAIEKMFPRTATKVAVFGCDWSGRYFATTSHENQTALPETLLLEPGVGEIFRIPVGIEEFHNVELVQYTNDALAENFFNEWRTSTDEELNPTSCVGYNVPLFLAGKDTIENLSVIDRDVYIEICTQLFNETMSLREGQSIRDIRMSL